MRKGQGRTMHARTKTRGVLIAALATLLSLVGAGTASAVVPGGLVPASCISSATAAPCVTAHDFGSPSAIAISPNGQNVYVVGTDVLGGTSLLTFDRNPATGQLVQKDGLDGCFRTLLALPGVPCRNFAAGTNLSGPTDIAITPDGSSLYVSNSGSSAILEFDRSPAGALSQKGSGLCVSNA